MILAGLSSPGSLRIWPAVLSVSDHLHPVPNHPGFCMECYRVLSRDQYFSCYTLLMLYNWWNLISWVHMRMLMILKFTVFQPPIWWCHQLDAHPSETVRLPWQVHERGTVYRQLSAQPPHRLLPLKHNLNHFCLDCHSVCDNVYISLTMFSALAAVCTVWLRYINCLNYFTLHYILSAVRYRCSPGTHVRLHWWRDIVDDGQPVTNQPWQKWGIVVFLSSSSASDPKWSSTCWQHICVASVRCSWPWVYLDADLSVRAHITATVRPVLRRCERSVVCAVHWRRMLCWVCSAHWSSPSLTSVVQRWLVCLEHCCGDTVCAERRRSTSVLGKEIGTHNSSSLATSLVKIFRENQIPVVSSSPSLPP